MYVKKNGLYTINSEVREWLKIFTIRAHQFKGSILQDLS